MLLLSAITEIKICDLWVINLNTKKRKEKKIHWVSAFWIELGKRQQFYCSIILFCNLVDTFQWNKHDCVVSLKSMCIVSKRLG